MAKKRSKKLVPSAMRTSHSKVSKARQTNLFLREFEKEVDQRFTNLGHAFFRDLELAVSRIGTVQERVIELERQAKRPAQQDLLEILNVKVGSLNGRTSDVENRLNYVEKHYLSRSGANSPPIVFDGLTSMGQMLMDLEGKKAVVKNEKAKRVQALAEKLRPRVTTVTGDLSRWRNNRKRLEMETQSLDEALNLLTDMGNFFFELLDTRCK